MNVDPIPDGIDVTMAAAAEAQRLPVLDQEARCGRLSSGVYAHLWLTDPLGASGAPMDGQLCQCRQAAHGEADDILEFLTPAPPLPTSRYFIVVLDNDGLRHWREGPGSGVPRNRQVVAYTNTPDGADRFRGHRLREGDQLISWGAWMTGRYANRVRNEVANIQRPG